MKIMFIAQKLRSLTAHRLRAATTDGKVNHDKFRDSLVEAASKFGFEGIMEYPVANYNGKGRNGRIDVVWRSKSGKNAIAFELDSRPRQKSIEKLKVLDPSFAVIVLYGDGEEWLKAKLEDLDFGWRSLIIKLERV